MKDLLSGWEEIEVINGRDEISGCHVTVHKVFHNTNKFNTSKLRVGEKITLKAEKGFFGTGVYLSSRPECTYGNTSFIIDSIMASLVCEEDAYSWYTVPTISFIINKIENENIYVSEVK